MAGHLGGVGTLKTGGGKGYFFLYLKWVPKGTRKMRRMRRKRGSMCTQGEGCTETLY
jgi:hypothetical protein